MTAKTTKKTPRKAAAKQELAVVSTQGTALQKQATDVMSMIEKVALNPDLPIERLERLFAFQKEVMAAQAKMDYDAAMARFQQLKEPVAHNRRGEGPGGSEYTYSDYPQMTKTISPWLKETQLSYTHRQHSEKFDDSGKLQYLVVDTIISHVSGHFETFSYIAIPDYKLEGKQAVNQIVQRSITYSKRQGLAEGLGLATAEDVDDLDSIKGSGTHVISEEQVANIEALLDEISPNKDARNSNLDRLFRWQKVQSVDAIPAKAYKDVVAQLEKARK